MLRRRPKPLTRPLVARHFLMKVKSRHAGGLANALWPAAAELLPSSDWHAGLALHRGPCCRFLQVLVDVNWRPVFFDDEAKAKKVITPYVLQADVLKVSLAYLDDTLPSLALTSQLTYSCSSLPRAISSLPA